MGNVSEGKADRRSVASKVEEGYEDFVFVEGEEMEEGVEICIEESAEE